MFVPPAIILDEEDSILFSSTSKNKKGRNKTMPKIISPPKAQQPEKRPIITTCPHCKYTISYTEDEVGHVSNDGLGIMCPNCGDTIILEHVEPFTFPNTFYHFGVNKGAVCLSDDEVQRYVDIVRHKLQQEREIGEYAITGSGDTMVFGFKMEDEDIIFVAKGYYEDSVFRN